MKNLKDKRSFDDYIESTYRDIPNADRLKYSKDTLFCSIRNAAHSDGMGDTTQGEHFGGGKILINLKSVGLLTKSPYTDRIFYRVEDQVTKKTTNNAIWKTDFTGSLNAFIGNLIVHEIGHAIGIAVQNNEGPHCLSCPQF